MPPKGPAPTSVELGVTLTFFLPLRSAGLSRNGSGPTSTGFWNLTVCALASSSPPRTRNGRRRAPRPTSSSATTADEPRRRPSARGAAAARRGRAADRMSEVGRSRRPARQRPAGRVEHRATVAVKARIRPVRRVAATVVAARSAGEAARPATCASPVARQRDVSAAPAHAPVAAMSPGRSWPADLAARELRAVDVRVGHAGPDRAQELAELAGRDALPRRADDVRRRDRARDRRGRRRAGLRARRRGWAGSRRTTR